MIAIESSTRRIVGFFPREEGIIPLYEVYLIIPSILTVIARIISFGKFISP
jgi:hypothetical protein